MCCKSQLFNAVNLRDVGQRLLAQKRAAYAQAQTQTNHVGRRVCIRPNPNRLTKLGQGSGWLNPLAASLQPTTTALEQSHTDVAATPLAATVAINPALLQGIVHNEQTSAGRLWLLCRALDPNGSGVLAVRSLRQQLTDKASYFGSWRRIRQVLAQGEGVFWQRANNRKGQPQLYLLGAATVGKRLAIGRLERHNVALPTADLLNGTQRARAAFYAAFHAGRDSNPIARATIARVTGLSERSQRVYDKLTHVKAQANYALTAQKGKDSAEIAAWQHGRAAFTFIDHHGQQGKAGSIYEATRLPNSYRSPLKRAAHGRRRKIARQLKDDLVTMGAQGNVNRPTRLFHHNGRQAAKANLQQGNVYLHLHNTTRTAQMTRGSGEPAHGWWQQLAPLVSHSR
ncbi:MAG TPA: hypothetical protein ENJ56_02890 [Anaerolineae bacterium]|nr:hypothetical protein [Anaerolineae bacterium]